MNAQRFHTIDLLRGVASLAVAWFHFAHDTPIKAMSDSGAYGYLGVTMFFVISGFIIPHTLLLANYDLTQYGTFLLKRIVRLDPAYLISIVVILVLGCLDRFGPGFHGPSPFHPTVPQVLLHLGYLNAFFNYPWLNVVFWTLAVEFQYYLFIGLAFPALTSRHFYLRLGVLLLMSLAALFLPGQYFFHYSFLFIMGFLTFYYRSGDLGWRTYLGGLAILGIGAAYIHEIPMALAGVGTASAIAFIDLQSNKMNFFGRISYSLYLAHLPIGGRILRLCNKFIPGTAGDLCGPFLALGGSIFAAWLLHRYVERPSQVWSSAIGYKSRQIAPSGFGPRIG